LATTVVVTSKSLSARPQVNFHAGGFVPQIQIARQNQGVERPGVHHLAGSHHPHLDFRLAPGKVREARHQPARGEHRRRGDDELGLGAALADHLHRGGEGVEALAQLRQAGARRFGELHAAPGAAEQLHAEELLEAFHLVADRGLRDVQLVRRLLEGEVTRRSFEHAQ
jgi:hypothetical protein